MLPFYLKKKKSINPWAATTKVGHLYLANTCFLCVMEHQFWVCSRWNFSCVSAQDRLHIENITFLLALLHMPHFLPQVPLQRTFYCTRTETRSGLFPLSGQSSYQSINCFLWIDKAHTDPVDGWLFWANPVSLICVLEYFWLQNRRPFKWVISFKSSACI